MNFAIPFFKKFKYFNEDGIQLNINYKPHIKELKSFIQQYGNHRINLIIDFILIEFSYEETVIMKCLNCDFEEEAPYDIIEECWEDGPYPIGYCPHCDKPKFVPLDIYNKKKKR